MTVRTYYIGGTDITYIIVYLFYFVTHEYENIHEHLGNSKKSEDFFINGFVLYASRPKSNLKRSVLISRATAPATTALR